MHVSYTVFHAAVKLKNLTQSGALDYKITVVIRCELAIFQISSFP